MNDRRDEPLPEAEVDRQFAALVEQFYAAGPSTRSSPVSPESSSGPADGDADWLTDHPLFSEPTSSQEPTELAGPLDPEPDTPLRWYGERPSDLPSADFPAYEEDGALPRPLMVGASMLAAVIALFILVTLGLPVPNWTGWLILAGLITSVLLILFNLSWPRDPDDDGARL